jgi:hypothetical protein
MILLHKNYFAPTDVTQECESYPRELVQIAIAADVFLNTWQGKVLAKYDRKM